MSKVFYPRLAAINIRKNSKTYFPYILTCIGTIAMYYMILALSRNPGLQQIHGGGTMAIILSLGAWITAIFSVIFLFYTNSFLMKRRKKEFGLYNILGMEKRHIARIIGWETAFIGVISLISGLLIGILLYKLMYLAVLKAMNADIPLGFDFSLSSLGIASLLFAGIFLLILLNSLRQIHLSKPIELLHGGAVGEKEPKARWILALIGFILLGAGYFISVTTANPVAALYRFFIAVILVIFGTYCLFTAGSIALLKLLRKNKNYYYRTKHFISVSGMMYRMKKNAAGLANICILSTMVLVTVSTTLSLYMGLDDIIHTMYPKRILITADNTAPDSQEIMHQWIDNTLEKNSLTAQNTVEYTYLTIVTTREENKFQLSQPDEDVNNMNLLFFIPVDDYNRSAGTSLTLKPEEALIYSSQSTYQPNTLKIWDQEFQVTQKLDQLKDSSILVSRPLNTYVVFVKDTSVLKQLESQFQQVSPRDESRIQTIYGFDLDADSPTVQTAIQQWIDTMEPFHFQGSLQSRDNNTQEIFGAYGGLFFIGIFLGILFLMATILIIYYKQISEGYEDKERFRIMQQVGMSHAEVKKSIHSQVLTVFFLPLITAAVHVAFSFPVVTLLLSALGLTNTALFTYCTIGCLLVFGVFYTLIYAATAKTYYKIVS